MTWPQSLRDCATTIISDQHVMMVGGADESRAIAGSWLFTINTKTWTKVTLKISFSHFNYCLCYHNLINMMYAQY